MVTGKRKYNKEKNATKATETQVLWHFPILLLQYDTIWYLRTISAKASLTQWIKNREVQQSVSVPFPLQLPYSLPWNHEQFHNRGEGWGHQLSPARQTLTPDTWVLKLGRNTDAVENYSYPGTLTLFTKGKEKGLNELGESKKSTTLKKIAGMWIPHSKTKLSLWKTVQKSVEPKVPAYI